MHGAKKSTRARKKLNTEGERIKEERERDKNVSEGSKVRKRENHASAYIRGRRKLARGMGSVSKKR